MRTRLSVLLTTFAAMLALGAGLFASASAQDTGTPMAGSSDASTPRPAHIHAGACPEVGDVVYPLEDVSSGMDMTMASTPMVTMGTPDASVDGMAIQSVTDVDASLDDILAAEHAVNVHESAESMGVYIACGDITGEPDDQGMLTIDLEELNDSGFSGEATLQDNGDGTTTVTVMLHGGDTMATPSN